MDETKFLVIIGDLCDVAESVDASLGISNTRQRVLSRCEESSNCVSFATTNQLVVSRKRVIIFNEALSDDVFIHGALYIHMV